MNSHQKPLMNSHQKTLMNSHQKPLMYYNQKRNPQLIKKSKLSLQLPQQLEAPSLTRNRRRPTQSVGIHRGPRFRRASHEPPPYLEPVPQLPTTAQTAGTMSHR